MAQNVQAACGRTDSHGGHWDTSRGRPCVGNQNVVTAVTAYDAALAYAAERGREDGTNAAGWYTQDAMGAGLSNVGRMNARRILIGIDDGDPAVMDSLPYADLSGEWADTLTGPGLVADAVAAALYGDDTAGETAYDAARADWFTDICDAYETAYSDAATDAIATAARDVLA
jgi:hypothetical protein